MSSTESPSARKPWQPPMPRTWWLKHGYYRRYMLREATVLPLLFFIGCWIVGLFCLAQGEAAWADWQRFMARPWVLLLNGLALLASLYHAKTFFELFPRVMPLRIGSRTLPSQLLIAAQWGATVTVAIVLLLLVRYMQ
jgi:fumarate reductase subunit C